MFNFKMEPATWESLKTIDQKLTEIHQILNTLNVAFFPYHILNQIQYCAKRQKKKKNSSIFHYVYNC